MTRKDYVAIAEALRTAVRGELNQNASAVYRWEIANAIADVCATDNQRFDRERFLKACGVAS